MNGDFILEVIGSHCGSLRPGTQWCDLSCRAITRAARRKEKISFIECGVSVPIYLTVLCQVPAWGVCFSHGSFGDSYYLSQALFSKQCHCQFVKIQCNEPLQIVSVPCFIFLPLGDFLFHILFFFLLSSWSSQRLRTLVVLGLSASWPLSHQEQVDNAWSDPMLTWALSFSSLLPPPLAKLPAFQLPRVPGSQALESGCLHDYCVSLVKLTSLCINFVICQMGTLLAVTAFWGYCFSSVDLLGLLKGSFVILTSFLIG